MIEKIANYEDVIDSRDVIARIEEIEDLLEDGELLDTEREELVEELRVLKKLAEEGKSASPDWEYGVPLIRDSYFKEYAQDYAEDIGAINSDASWPYTCIDWEQAARELRMDYTAVYFDGVIYWVR